MELNGWVTWLRRACDLWDPACPAPSIGCVSALASSVGDSDMHRFEPGDSCLQDWHQFLQNHYLVENQGPVEHRVGRLPRLQFALECLDKRHRPLRICLINPLSHSLYIQRDSVEHVLNKINAPLLPRRPGLCYVDIEILVLVDVEKSPLPLCYALLLTGMGC